MKSLLTGLSLALAAVSPAFAGIDWGFDNHDTAVNASGGAGTATITLGAFNTGFHSGASLIPWNLGGAPGASGYWDLGRAGSIMLSGVSANGPVTITVFEWVNAGTYGGALNYAVNGVRLGDFHEVAPVASSPGLPGAWWEYDAHLGTALTPADTVTITAGYGGAIIDRLTVVPEPTTLIAGAILLIPFAISTWPVLCRRRSSNCRVAGDSDSAARKLEKTVSAPKERR
jgi:hypothetical protein